MMAQSGKVRHLEACYSEPVRVLGGVRQSKTRDLSVSPEQQRKKITDFSDSHGHRLVATPTDLSRSGKVSAFVRPELGPWLTETHLIAKWDLLVATKLDRLCRNTADYLGIRDWCAKNDKKVILLSNPELDDDSPFATAMATVVAAFAQMERELASMRRLETLAELESQGRWGGGRVPYGYRGVKTPEGWFLEPDDGGTAVIAEQMAKMAIAGQSNRQIAAWLNEGGIPTQIGKSWLTESVRLVLHSRNMRGLLDEDDFAGLQRALRERAQRRGQWTSGEHQLLRVAYCATDKAPLYGSKRKGRPDVYRCVQCNMNARKDMLEAEVEADLLARFGSRPMTETEIIPGDDHGKEINRLEAQLEQARDLDFVDTTPLETEIDRLKNLPHEPDRENPVPTGLSIAETWHATPYEERGPWLRAHKVKVWVAPGCKILLEPTWLATVAGFTKP